MNRSIALMFMCMCFSAAANAANTGKLTAIMFSGPDDPNHANIVQIMIEGGFSNGACDPTLAAVRNTPDRKELIAFLLTAYATNQSVTIVLNPNDAYFGTRCSIARVSNQ